MFVSSASPLAVASVLWSPRPDALVFTVISKATFALANGPCLPVEPSDPLVPRDLPWPAVEPSCVRVPTDLLPFKRYVDVMLSGHAYAPGNKPVPALNARLAVGTINKTVGVFGDRKWLPSGAPSEALLFVRMPLSWDLAAAGPSGVNPIGIAPSITSDPWRRPRVPNLLPHGFVLRNPNEVIPPAGFGPISPYWPSRAIHVRKYGASFSAEKWFESPLPLALDASYFNQAPNDQQMLELPLQMQIALENLHPDLPRLVAVIEDLRPKATVSRPNTKTSHEVWLRGDTLFIDTDRAICTVTWRGSIPLSHPREEGTVYVEPTRGITTPSSKVPKSPPKPNAPLAVDAEVTLVQKANVSTEQQALHQTLKPALPGASSPALPFKPPAKDPPKPHVALATEAEVTRIQKANVSPEQQTLMPALPGASSPALPFRPPSASSPDLPFRPPSASSPELPPPAFAAVPSPPSGGVPRVKTWLPIERPVGETVLPFRPSPKTPEENGAEPSIGDRLPVLGAPSAMPLQAPIPSSQEQSTAPIELPNASPVLPFRAPIQAPSEAPPLPMEPLAPAKEAAPRPLMMLSATPTALPQNEPKAEREKLEVAAQKTPKTELSLSLYARIKVDVWGAEERLDDALRRHGIHEIEWRVHERRQSEALDEEARSGKCELALSLMAALDAARAQGAIAPEPPSS